MIERMTGGIIRAVALLCLASPVAAAADDQNAAAWLQPSSTWQVDYAEADCRLLRRFGEGDAAVYLELKRGLAFDSYAWTLYGAALPKYTERVDLTIALEPQGREYRVEALPYVLVDRPEKLLKWSDTDRTIGGAMRDDQRLRFTSGQNLDVRVSLSGMAAAVKALETCQSDLLASWGLSADYLSRIAVKPEPATNAGRWATNDDYPSNAKRARSEGIATFLLSVSAEGKTVDCRIVGSSGFRILDDRMCHLMRSRAVFHPARDKEGKAVPSFYVNRVRWQIPR
jgi:TonB family protein